MKLEIKNMTCGYGHKKVINNVSVCLQSGEILCLLGPNGSGKTTFFKSILGLLKVHEGAIVFQGESIKGWSHSKIAKAIGYIPQAHNPPFPFSVLDVVLMGRTAHLGNFSTPGDQDVQIAVQAIEDLNIAYLQDRIYTEISGGERQLVLIARALTQQPQILVMDEPTTGLDFGNQLLVLSHIKKLARRGLAIIMSSHYPEHAFHYATKALLFKEGQVFAQGLPNEVVTENSIKALYGTNVKIISIPTQNNKEVKVCIPREQFD